MVLHLETMLMKYATVATLLYRLLIDSSRMMAKHHTPE